jgi:hypothetical protein
MCTGNDNQVDWTAAATPHGEGVSAGLAPSRKPKAVPHTKRSVMDTLLGKNNLSATDISGSDPYNATGRHIRPFGR